MTDCYDSGTAAATADLVVADLLGDEGGDCAKSVGEDDCSGDGYAIWPAAEQLLESLEGS